MNHMTRLVVHTALHGCAFDHASFICHSVTLSRVNEAMIINQVVVKIHLMDMVYVVAFGHSPTL